MIFFSADSHISGFGYIHNRHRVPKWLPSFCLFLLCSISLLSQFLYLETQKCMQTLPCHMYGSGSEHSNVRCLLVCLFSLFLAICKTFRYIQNPWSDYYGLCSLAPLVSICEVSEFMEFKSLK